MTKKTTLFNQKDLIAYFLIAGAGAIVQLICGGLLKDWFKLNYESTILPAYFISVIVGFTLTKLFAFDARKTQQTNREMIKFLMVATFSGFVTWFFSVMTYKFIQTLMSDFYFQIPFAYKKSMWLRSWLRPLEWGLVLFQTIFCTKLLPLKVVDFTTNLRSYLSKIRQKYLKY